MASQYCEPHPASVLGYNKLVKDVCMIQIVIIDMMGIVSSSAMEETTPTQTGQ